MDILKKPLITEKLSALGEKLNRYGFKVESKSNKIEIKNAVQRMYPDVKVVDVRTATILGKPKSRHTKRGVSSGRTSTYKKAFVIR